MKNNQTLKILAAIFALRARYYRERWEQEQNEVFLGEGCAYENAFDMLAYAAQDNGWGWDCLCQFGWADEAEAIINKLGADVDFWDLENFIKEGLDKQPKA